MNLIEEFLGKRPYLLLDGAMGTVLMEAGLEQGAPPEEWNALYPQRIQAVHEAYIEAGSQLILTNSFGGTQFRLKLHHLHERVHELNCTAAAIARAAADAAPHPVIVAGSMGPTGELLAPMGTMTFAEAQDAFSEQAAGLAEGGVDLLWIETMSDLDEVHAAIAGARAVCDLPIAASMTFDTHGRTMMGTSPVEAIESLRESDLVAIGGNCGNGVAEIEIAIKAMHEADPSITLIAKSNAGIPRWVGDELVYDGTPEVMAGYAYRVRELGAQLIGGCCGSTPAHIRAMAAALEGKTPVSELQKRPPATTPPTSKKKAKATRLRRHRRRR